MPNSLLMSRRSLLGAGLGAATLKTAELLRPASEIFARPPSAKVLRAACEIVPFPFTGLTTHHSMGGIETTHTRLGFVGAVSSDDSKYMVHNSGESDDKDLVEEDGEVRINFKATIPSAGTWHVLLPHTQHFRMKGHSQVVGHGNATTSWDAKVLFTFNQSLKLGSAVLESSEEEILFDRTRSQDRTTTFSKDRKIVPRYVTFDANGGEVLSLILELEVDTSANEDGTAIGSIDLFGFPSNADGDMDTIVVKQP